MTRQLVFVHGRGQAKRDAVELKRQWLTTLGEGFAKSHLTLPIAEPDVRFAFYGDTLADLVEGKSPAEAARVIVRGTEADEDEKRFALSIIEEIRTAHGITEDQLAEVAGAEVIDRGPLNWPWLRAVVKALDRNIPCASGPSIALFTHDVYQYLTNSDTRETIEEGITAAITPGIETVVVAHSLGTVVAYNLLRREGLDRGWKIPLFVTVGAPLAVTVIRETLAGFAPLRTPECVTHWVNAMDNRDIVALYPLDPNNFPIDPAEPAIENRTDIRNDTENRHGISGYLDDGPIAQRIHDALTKS